MQEVAPHSQGRNLHQLRHSALQHLAEAGRTAPELQATSRHQNLGSLGRYVRLGEETSARITAEHDPAARRRRR
ncbi:site-specific integrase [Nonomuraea rhizosphaerae]|uniref:site-specific integrase n=1 Tax=Nonomuraea rhizosphaerae TaxID=2665663 RepID=UPI001C5D50F0|nr:site-specific integrase [Nonomuraea rhizosphaerae]